MREVAHAGRLVVAAVLIAIPGAARADDALAKARAALDQSDYLGARDALTKALGAGDNDREAVVEIYRMSGIVAGALGEAGAATEAFERMLALAPKAELPAGTSPKIARPFAAAQKYWQDHAPLAIDVDTRARPPGLTVTIESDPLAMIERIRAIARIDGGKDELNEQPVEHRLAIELRAGKRIDVRVVALDGHGNRLIEVGTADVPLVIVGEDERPKPGTGTAPTPRPGTGTGTGTPGGGDEPAPRSRPLYAKWWLWGGVAIGFAAGAGYFAWDARKQADQLDRLNSESSQHQFTEALAVEDRARRDVLFANIGFGVAGAAAIAATILFLTEPGPARTGERRATVAPAPVAGGGAVVVEVPF